jgi:hypothetical protein
MRLIGNHSIILNESQDNYGPAGSSNIQEPVNNHGKASASYLAKEYQLEIVAEAEHSCKSTSDHGIEANILLANESTSPALTPQYSSKSRPER